MFFSSLWGYNGFTQRRWPCQDESCPSLGSRKARERCAKDVSTRAMSCPKFAQLFVSARNMKAQAGLQGKRSNISQWHVDCFHIHSYRQHIYCIVCNRICLIPYIWFLIRILDFGKCNPYGTAKGGERFAKDLRKGGSWELLFSTTFILILKKTIFI